MRGAVVTLHVYYNSALGGEYPGSLSCRFTPRKNALGVHWIGPVVKRKLSTP
jgi:hypothetical protein